MEARDAAAELERQRRLQLTWKRLKGATDSIYGRLHEVATRTHAVAVHRRHDPELTQTLQQIVEVTKPFIYCGMCSMKLPSTGFRGRQEVFVGACGHLFHASNPEGGPTCFQKAHSCGQTQHCVHCGGSAPCPPTDLPPRLTQHEFSRGRGPPPPSGGPGGFQAPGGPRGPRFGQALGASHGPESVQAPPRIARAHKRPRPPESGPDEPNIVNDILDGKD